MNMWSVTKTVLEKKGNIFMKLKYVIYTLIMLELVTTIMTYAKPVEAIKIKIWIDGTEKEIDTVSMDQLRTSSHNLAFGVDNLLIEGISQRGKNTWDKYIESLNMFVDGYIAQGKIGHRFTRYETLLVRTLTAINTRSKKLLKTIDDLRTQNNNFAKNQYQNINLNMVTEEIGALHPENLDEYVTLLNPAEGDTQDDKDIKKMLQNVVITLQVTIQKLEIDFNKIKDAIYMHINAHIIDALAHALYALAQI